MRGKELFCSREFRCKWNATTLSCYVTPCSPWLHGMMVCTQFCIILIFYSLGNISNRVKNNMNDICRAVISGEPAISLTNLVKPACTAWILQYASKAYTARLRRFVIDWSSAAPSAETPSLITILFLDARREAKRRMASNWCRVPAQSRTQCVCVCVCIPFAGAQVATKRLRH